MPVPRELSPPYSSVHLPSFACGAEKLSPSQLCAASRRPTPWSTLVTRSLGEKRPVEARVGSVV